MATSDGGKNNKKLVAMEAGNWVFSGDIKLRPQLLKTFFAMAESDKPKGLACMSDDRLLWVNEPMTSLLRTPAPEATKRDMKDFWLPGDLEELKRRCHQERKFIHVYEAAMAK